jgi:Flp pilus assembly pilin Flp
VQHLQTPLRRFLRTETGGAAVLHAAILAALAWANVDPAGYAATWHAVLVIRSGRWELAVAPCRNLRCPFSVNTARHGSPSVSGG